MYTSCRFVGSEVCPWKSSKCNFSKTDLLFFALLIYPIISIYLQKFLFISVIVSEKVQNVNMNKGQNLQNKTRKSYVSCALHIYRMRSIYIQSVLFISMIILALCPDNVQCQNEQRAINPKSDKAELQFLCTAHLLNEIYLPTTSLANIYCTFRTMSWRKFKV
jgi:hypothetical protein